MNDFQKKAVAAVMQMSVLRNDEQLAFHCVRGRKENFLLATTWRKGHSFQVYIYDDEAGYMKNGTEWTVFERPDFSDDETLINSFVSSLEESLKPMSSAAK